MLLRKNNRPGAEGLKLIGQELPNSIETTNWLVGKKEIRILY